MANFITTLFKLTDSANYFFWKIHIKSTFALIIYSEDILNTSALPQTTDINKIARRNFLGSQALAVLNSTLPDNIWPT